MRFTSTSTKGNRGCICYQSFPTRKALWAHCIGATELMPKCQMVMRALEHVTRARRIAHRSVMRLEKRLGWSEIGPDDFI